MVTWSPAFGLDWLKPCTDWRSQVSATVPDPAKGFIFVAMGKCETVPAIDLETNKVIAAQKAGDGEGGSVFVGTWKGDTVEIYDSAGNRQSSIKGGDPTHFAVTPDGRFLYVTNFGSGDVTVADIGTRKRVAAIPVGDKPLGLIASGDGRQILVASMADEMVAVIDVASQTVSRRIRADGEPQHLALARDGRTVYITIPHDGRVDVLDTVDLEWRARIKTGPSPQQIAPRYGDR